MTPDGTIRLNDPLKIIVKGESDTKTFNETSKDMNAKFDSVISNLLRR